MGAGFSPLVPALICTVCPMTVMLPVAIVGQVPEAAGIVGPSPDVVTVPDDDPPPSLLEPPDPDPLPDPVPEDPEPELVPLELVPPLPLPPWDPELPPCEDPELLAVLASLSSPPETLPLDVPCPGPPRVGSVPLAHPTTADAPSHARTVQRTSVIELTLQSFA